MYAYTPDVYMQQASPSYPVMNSSSSSGYSGSPMGTPMASPSFPMAGSFLQGPHHIPQQPQPQQLQQVQQQQQQIRGFEEAMIAQQYFAWYGHMTAMQAGAFPASACHPHQFYHPYSMTPALQAAAASDARPGQSARLPFSKSQLAALNERFDKSDSIKVDERREMSKRIGLSEVQIKVWFQNRRFKLRKIKKAQMEMAQMGGQQTHQDDTMDSEGEEDADE
ncbi:Protein CBR-CEH-51 [Caenorhabditis briggsae]|uniref:Homeobox domain-containing protein n=2 Tax=Caenorhabditis briggsae TaxID=6238 RepID=A0AAE9D2H1_CAEBR|nr:Protein CBR-CEH-51 [Caenorhabditis briggsae]ULT92438.1 hypothetical protein L3Y34_009904 [Caenorhabditis briggsae]CAP37360.2 Protein CBR-CEH-51 [Caenorhabditis briggsae]